MYHTTMNLSNLTNAEFIRYLELESNDPIILRLCRLVTAHDEITEDLIWNCGLDEETKLFENTYEPWRYIKHLDGELEYYQDELQKLSEENVELHRRLETRTVAELLKEAVFERDSAKALNSTFIRDIKKLETERDAAKDKLSMWAKLNGNFTGT